MASRLSSSFTWNVAPIERLDAEARAFDPHPQVVGFQALEHDLVVLRRADRDRAALRQALALDRRQRRHRVRAEVLDGLLPVLERARLERVGGRLRKRGRRGEREED